MITLWNAPWQPIWRATGIACVSGTVLVSSLAVFVPASRISNPLLPSVRYPPLVRPDLAEIERLIEMLDQLKPERVYVVASSEILNWSTLNIGCRVNHRDICQHIAVTADIDARDGFPKDLLQADYVVVATPIQYHVRPEDQQVVGLVAQQIIQHAGIGSSFESVPGQFTLMNGVQARIYRRSAPLRREDVRDLSDELIRSYPGMKSLFTPPPGSAT